MPTFLEQFADTEIKVRHKEPFLTAGLNEAFTGVIPKGIHRGFKLIAHPTLPGTLTVVADAADNDHVAAYTTDDGYTIRIRRDGGDFNLSLNNIAFANKTLVIAIFTEYLISTTTSSVIRAYELDPTDEFTGAPERGELVVLGQVVMPADPTADLIVSTNVTPRYRTLAWEEVGSDAAPWKQIVENGSFELAASGPFVASDRGQVPHWDTQYLPTQHSWEIETTNPHTGQYCLKVTGTGVAPLLGSVIPTDRIIAVQPGQLIRVSFWVRGENWPVIGPAGTMGFQLNFYGANLSFLAFRVAQDKSLNGTFPWTRVDQYVEVPDTPSGIQWCVPSIVVLDNPTPATASESLVFDDVRVWVAGGPPTIPFSSVQDGLTNGGHVVGQLGIAETNVSQFGLTQTLETFVQGILSLHKLDQLLGVNRYRWKRLDEEPFNLRLDEGSVHCTGMGGTTTEAMIPRFAAETPDPLVVAWSNLIEASSADPTLLGRIRRYCWITGFDHIMFDLLNAYIDLSIGQYRLDDVGQDAAIFTVNSGSGGAGANIGLQGRAAADGTPFAAPQPLMGMYGDPTTAAPNCWMEMIDGYLSFPLSGVTTNPAVTTTPTANALYGITMPKAWGLIDTGATLQLRDGFNIDESSCSYVAGRLLVDFRRNMNAPSGAYYAVLLSAIRSNAIHLVASNLADGTFQVEAFNTSGVAIPLDSNSEEIMFVVFARQNS